jgi:hypothetical protein
VEPQEIKKDFADFCSTCFQDMQKSLVGYTIKYQSLTLPDSVDFNDMTMLHVTGLVSPQGKQVDFVVRCYYQGAEVYRKVWFVYPSGDLNLSSVLEPIHNILQATLHYYKSSQTLPALLQ